MTEETVVRDALEEAFVYVSQMLRSIGSRAALLAGERILFTGFGPYDVEDLRTLVPNSVETFDHDDRIEAVDLVVVGENEWSPDSIEVAFGSNFPPPRFVPQEGFLDELLFGHDWWNDFYNWLNAVADRHDGLAFARDLFDAQFPWPSTEAEESQVGGVGRYAEETDLRREGYQISGLDREERWVILTSRAIPALGLQEVVYTIAGHVRRSKRQRGGRERFQYAIAEWEHDLERLKERFWRGPSQFRWPGTEP